MNKKKIEKLWEEIRNRGAYDPHNQDMTELLEALLDDEETPLAKKYGCNCAYCPYRI